MRWNIAGVGEIVGAFGRSEGVERLAEGVPEGVDGAFGAMTQQPLLNLAKAFSMGLRSGLYGGKNNAWRAADSIASRRRHRACDWRGCP